MSRLLNWAGKITCPLNVKGGRSLRMFGQQSLRRSLRYLEELEGRIVPTLLGQQLFPSDNPYNQNISNAPVAANSAAVITHIGASIGIHPDWGEDSAINGNDPLYGIPVNIVHGNSATVTKVNVVIDNYPGESNVQATRSGQRGYQGDYQNGPNTNGGGYNSGQRGDSHLIVWDEDNNIAYELYGVTRPSDPTLFPNNSSVELSHTDGQWHAAQETVWNMNTDTFRTRRHVGGRGGLSILAGLARPDEGLPISPGRPGSHRPCLRTSFRRRSSSVRLSRFACRQHFVRFHQTALWGALALENTPAVNAVIATLGPEAQIIAHAMQQYGLILADIGSSMYVSGTSASVDANNNINLTWNMNDVLGLNALTAGDFQVVNLTPVVTGLSGSSGPAGSTITLLGQNFSGAAGQLSVFFGSTAATSVTVVDDSHITAVVPNGTEPLMSPSSRGSTKPTTSATAPRQRQRSLFGYGTSAISTADQFTYSGQPISGANSTDSIATSSVTSGLTDTLTITVKDVTGAAVSGLSSGAFGFTFSGRTTRAPSAPSRRPRQRALTRRHSPAPRRARPTT